MQRSLFVSHAAADRAQAENLATLLRKSGLPVECSRLPDEALAGAGFWSELDRTILGCDVFVVLCSRRTLTPAALAELTAAVTRFEKEPSFAIVPALLGGLDARTLPAPLRPHQYIVLPADLLGASDAEREEVVRQFRGLIRVKQEPARDAVWQRVAERVAAHLEYDAMTLRPQAGLTPLGPDPDSLLEEFSVDGTGVVPARGANERLTLGDGSSLVMVLVPGGEFSMGASDAELEARVSRAAEHPRRQVRVAPFFISKTPVTQLQFACISGWSRAQHRGPRLAATDLDWSEAHAWSARLGLHLPSEAQWEYACRARSVTRYSSGDREEDLARVGWFAGNSDGRPQSVGKLPPNRFGLHDMHGLVWEWCADAWHDTYVQAPLDGSPWLAARATHAVARGGAWFGPAANARSAERRAFQLDARIDTLGFRPARAILD